jgi:hypothetical protein
MSYFNILNFRINSSVTMVENGQATEATAASSVDEGAKRWRRKAKECLVTAVIAITASTNAQSQQATEAFRDFFVAPITEPAGDDIGREQVGKHGILVESLIEKRMYVAAIEIAKEESVHAEKLVAIISREGTARDAFTALRDLTPSLDGRAGLKASANLLSRIVETGDANEGVRAMSWMYAKPERYERLQADQGVALAKMIAKSQDVDSIRNAQSILAARFEHAFFIDPASFNELRESLQKAYLDAEKKVHLVEQHVRDNPMFSPSHVMDYYLEQKDPITAMRYVLYHQERLGRDENSDVSLSQHAWLSQQQVDTMARIALQSGDAYDVATVAATMPVSGDVLRSAVSFVAQHGTPDSVLHLAAHVPIYHVSELQAAVAQRGSTADLMRYVAEVRHADLPELRSQIEGRQDAKYASQIINQIEAQHRALEAEGIDLDSATMPAVESRPTVVM